MQLITKAFDDILYSKFLIAQPITSSVQKKLLFSFCVSYHSTSYKCSDILYLVLVIIYLVLSSSKNSCCDCNHFSEDMLTENPNNAISLHGRPEFST